MEEMPKLDKKDSRILHELDYNARIGLKELGKRVGLSPQMAKYRVDRLCKNGVIRGSMAVVDFHRLGFYTYRAYLRFQKTTEKEEKGIIEYFVRHPRTIWVTSSSGRWDMEVVFLAKNPMQVNEFLRAMKKGLGEKVRSYSVSPAMVNYHFGRAYLGGGGERKTPKYGGELPVEELDKADLRIMKELSLDAWVSNQEIAKKVGLSFNTVKARIAGLEKRGVIQAYRIFVDLGKIGRTFYKAMISSGGIGEEEEQGMVSFCMREDSVVYLVETAGEWDLEVEAEVRDEEEFRGIMGRFRNAFSGVIRDYEILHIYKEHKINYFPMADEMVATASGQVKKSSA